MLILKVAPKPSQTLRKVSNYFVRFTVCGDYRQQKAEAAAKAAVKQKGKRNAKLLSFDEEEDAEDGAVPRAKISSYHDAVEDKR